MEIDNNELFENQPVGRPAAIGTALQFDGEKKRPGLPKCSVNKKTLIRNAKKDNPNKNKQKKIIIINNFFK